MRKLKKRVREIGLKYSSLSGQISSKKIQKPVQFESSLERDFIYLLEFDTRVKRYLEQPLEIPYIDLLGKSRKYTPDFIISYHDKFRKNEIVEIKYQKDLLEHEQEYDHKFEEARKYCIKHNLVFRLCTERYIREKNGTLLRNVKFLSRFRDYYDNINYKATGLVVNTANSHNILNYLRKIKRCSIKELIEYLEQYSDDKYLKGKLIFLIWYLIANNFIYSDLDKWLNFDSIIWTDS